MSQEDRDRLAQRKARKRERDAALWFVDISLLERCLAALRARNREKKGRDVGRVEEEGPDETMGIEEGDEEKAEEMEEAVPRLQRTRSIEERAPMPIITSPPNVTPAAVEAKVNDEVEKGDTMDSAEDEPLTTLSTFVSPPSASAATSVPVPLPRAASPVSGRRRVPVVGAVGVVVADGVRSDVF